MSVNIQQREKLKKVIISVLKERKNQLIFLLGPRGSGKSHTLDLVLKDIKDSFNKKNQKTPFYSETIYLNGRVTPNPKDCLDEILSQSHEKFKSSQSSKSEKLNFLIEISKRARSKNKTLLLVLDNFDKFSQSKSSSFFNYTLADLLHSDASSIMIICLARNILSLNNLEKRIRSRISNFERIIFSTNFSAKDITILMKSFSKSKKNYNGRECKRRIEKWRKMGKPLSFYLNEAILKDLSPREDSFIRNKFDPSQLPSMELLLLVAAVNLSLKNTKTINFEKCKKEAASASLRNSTVHKFDGSQLEAAFRRLVVKSVILVERNSNGKGQRLLRFAKIKPNPFCFDNGSRFEADEIPSWAKASLERFCN